MKRFVAVLVVALAASNTAFAEGPAPETPDPDLDAPSRLQVPDVGGVGEVADLAPGDRAPDFRAASTTGTRVTEEDLLGQISLLLFAPDGSALSAMSAVSDSLRAVGVHTYGICPESKRATAAAAAGEGLTFPVLSDPSEHLARGFGMFDAEGQTPRSGFVLLNEKGIVRVLVQTAVLSPPRVLQTVRQSLVPRQSG